MMKKFKFKSGLFYLVLISSIFLINNNALPHPMPKYYGIYLVDNDKLINLDEEYDENPLNYVTGDNIKFLLFFREQELNMAMEQLKICTMKYYNKKINFTGGKFAKNAKKEKEIGTWIVTIDNDKYYNIVDKGIAPVPGHADKVYLEPKNTLSPGAYGLIHNQATNLAQNIFGGASDKEAYHHFKFFINKNFVESNMEKYCINKVWGEKGQIGISKFLSKTQSGYKVKPCYKLQNIVEEKNKSIEEVQTLLSSFKPLSQLNPTNYRDKQFIEKKDTIPGSNKLTSVKNLTCAAAVYTMIERSYGKNNVYIDDLYEFGKGARKPQYVSKDFKIDFSFIDYSIKLKQPVILHGYGGPLKEHFALLVGYYNNNESKQYIIYDPYPANEKSRYVLDSTSELNHPNLPVKFKSMRMLNMKQKKIGKISKIVKSWNLIIINKNDQVLNNKDTLLCTINNNTLNTLKVRELKKNTITSTPSKDDISLFKIGQNVYTLQF